MIQDIPGDLPEVVVTAARLPPADQAAADVEPASVEIAVGPEVGV